MDENTDRSTFHDGDDIDPETSEALDGYEDLDDVDEESLEEPEPPALLYPRLDLYVEDFLAVIYERSLPNGRRTWCPQWWKHDEAVYRLQALWLSWEYMRVNDGANGPATWLVNYADPIMAVLFEVEGPFKGCSVEHGHREERPHNEARLPCEPSPEGLFEERS
jgi:hypothetical protein